MARFTDEELMRKVQEGFIVESEADMTETYKKALINQITVQGDTELMSAPAYWMAAKDAPSTNTMVSATAIIQDELGHANIAYRLLQDLGVDTDELLYDRPPNRFKNPFGFDQPLANWAELVTAQRTVRSGRNHPAQRRAPPYLVRAVEASAREGRDGGELPPPARRGLDEEAVRGGRRGP